LESGVPCQFSRDGLENEERCSKAKLKLGLQLQLPRERKV